ncbi:MAG: hypothetical protein ACRCTD_12185 [Beijerinckiaceae bacterium]
MAQFRALTTALVLAGALTFSSFAHAGAFRDAEAQIASAYADYRVALMKTNQKDKAGSEAALSGFVAKWTALANQWRAAPPPQYGDDAALGATLEAVKKAAEDADVSLRQGDIAKSHDQLEIIRDQLSDLRARNGITSFSDRMNAYHAHMEHVVSGAYDQFSAQGLIALREDAAVLAYLADEIVKAPVRGDRAAFNEMAASIAGSVKALRAALAAGDIEAAKKARTMIKPAYSRMFGRFG